MRKFMFYIKQIIPEVCWSKYKTPDGKKHIAIWRQWFGKVFNYCQFTVD